MTDAAMTPRTPLRRLREATVGTQVTLAILALLVLVPTLLESPFVYHVFITICIYAALSTAWNIVGGFAGQMSLGHPIFYGIGAYAATLLAIHLAMPPWFGMIFGAVLSSMVGVAISYPCFRLKGSFFALATVAFLEVIRLLAIHFSTVTGGSAGLIVPLRLGWTWMIFREKWPYLVITFGLLLVTILVSLWIKRSRFGYRLIAIREREDSALAMGIDATRMKILAVIISSFLTSIVGSVHAMYLTFIDPQTLFSIDLAVQIAMFPLIGGIGTVAGPLAGTLLVVPIAELARGWLGASANGLHGFVYGTVLVIVVLTVPRGLAGHFIPYLERRFRRGADAARAVGLAPRGQPPETGPVPPIGDVILAAEGLTKRFGGVLATGDVSIEVRQGEVLGIIGPNGAGKTTLFNLLSGFILPDEGRVRVRRPDGTWTSPDRPYAFARAGIGRTFQIAQPFSGLTVLENIMIGAFLWCRSEAEARANALEVAEVVGLRELCDQEARSLTVGGLKRLELARVLATRPRIILLDEVMAGLNLSDVQRAVELIRAIRRRGTTVIAIEHVMQAILALSDRMVVISSGKVIARGTPEEIVRDPVVIEAYLGEDFVHAQAR